LYTSGSHTVFVETKKSFGLVLSEENISANQKQNLSMLAMFLLDQE
jgi:hypothetical protein